MSAAGSGFKIASLPGSSMPVVVVVVLIINTAILTGISRFG